jgi:ribosomal protein S18 acetylase RimI-like enzyme
VRGRLTAKELSARTWPDFERLFTQEGNGWNSCACMLCHRGHHLSRTEFPTAAARAQQNRKEKKDLVENDRSHGILVYSDGEPVGWCQFGSTSELPFADGATDTGERTWRITCFVTHKRFRQQGVARFALRAAIAAILKRGGGLIEAHPLAVDSSWPYTGTVQLFEGEGFKEVRRFEVNSTDFPRYDRNQVTAGKQVVVMHRSV